MSGIQEYLFYKDVFHYDDQATDSWQLAHSDTDTPILILYSRFGVYSSVRQLAVLRTPINQDSHALSQSKQPVKTSAGVAIVLLLMALMLVDQMFDCSCCC